MSKETDKHADIGEVIFEFLPLGVSVKVSAIHVATSTEVSIVGPGNAARVSLERTALAKLCYVLNKKSAKPGGAGIIC